MAGKSTKPYYNGITFDSNEEREFYWWCEEAKQHGFITEFQFHPPAIEVFPKQQIPIKKYLKTKTKVEYKHLLNPLTYTADFILKLTSKMNAFKHGLFSHDSEYWIDIKGAATFAGMRFNDGAVFSDRRKAIYATKGIFINKVVPKTQKNNIGFFDKTWVPEKARFSFKQKKLRACYRQCRTVLQCLNLPENYPPPEICAPPQEHTDLFNQPEPFPGWV